MNRLHYVYITTNNINGKKYIGQRCPPDKKDPEKDSYLGSGILITKSVKKYGRENFSKEIIFLSESQSETDKKEIELIKKYDCLNNRDSWYNRDPGGQYGRSENHASSVSENMKDFYSDPENKKKYLTAVAKKYGFDSWEKFQEDRKEKSLTKKKENKKIAETKRLEKKEKLRLKIESEKLLRKSPLYISTIEYKKKNCLSSTESKKNHAEKRKKNVFEKYEKSGNPIAIAIIENDIYPIADKIKTSRYFYELFSGHFRPGRNTAMKNTKKLVDEINRKYNLSLSVIDCVDWYISKYGDFKTA